MKKRIIILAIVLIASALLSFFGYEIYKGKIDLNDLNIFSKHKDSNTKTKNNDKGKDTKDDTTKEEEKPKLKIINLDSKTRTIAVMIDNERGAWPQAGLQDAYITYEIIVEGGITRFMALYKDTTTAMIGPCRSARHYFIDYALENDAIFTHFGFSPQAESDIKTYGVNDISGTENDGSAFWREKVITTSWQNVFTSISNLTNRATEKGYRMTSSEEPLLSYSATEINMASLANAKIANSVYIVYSTAQNVKYEYDSVNKVYKRFQQGTAHVDRVTGQQYTVKNIIVYGVQNYALNDGSGKDRQGLNDIGNGTGYYISGGYAIPITWSKTARDSRTVYKDSSGKELTVNDGNTFIQIQPLNQTLTIQ